MSKKRPRGTQGRSSSGSRAGGKQKPDYWLGRVFRCRYTYKGKLRRVRHWSVKIQHLGRRRTFPLQSNRRGEAAIEACEVYRTLIRRGWVERPMRPSQGVPAVRVGPQGPAILEAQKLQAVYWEQRLIHREYTMDQRPGATSNLSIRIDHGGTGHYFPLGTDNRQSAARRALQIYRTILHQGWEAADRRFSRELTVAFRWLDSPLAWTYTTIHTLTAAADRGQPAVGESSGQYKVAVAESDAEIRRALEWCLDHMEGFRCTASYATGAEAVKGMARNHPHLALISHSLVDQPGTTCLTELKAAVPEIPGLLYSVYEDSEELFRATPGGAGTYLLRRMAPTEFLRPVAGRLTEAPLAAGELALAAWQYFKEAVAAMPIGSAGRHLASLTHREHEVLGLLSKGHPDKDIADRLGISIHTVHEHVRNIFEKLGARNRTEAAVKFFQK